MDHLCQFRVFLPTGNGVRGAEQSGVIMGLLFGKQEELIQRFGRGGVVERDVNGEVGIDAVICSPWKRARLALGLD